MPSKSTTPRRVRLTPTDLPGVYRNKTGTLVDENNVAISFKSLRTKDQKRWSEALNGAEAVEPADILKAVALDPRFPLHTRLDAAHKAAPYFTAKRLAIQGKGPSTGAAIDWSSIPQDKLDEVEKALELIKNVTGAQL